MAPTPVSATPQVSLPRPTKALALGPAYVALMLQHARVSAVPGIIAAILTVVVATSNAAVALASLRQAMVTTA